MRCDRCGKDFCAWSELHSVTRIDNTPNFYSIFNPVKPKKEWVCLNCLDYRYNLLNMGNKNGYKSNKCF